MSQTGSSDCFEGSSQGNPKCPVPMALQCHSSAERRCWGMIPIMVKEVAVVESSSLRCFQSVCDCGNPSKSSTESLLRLNPRRGAVSTHWGALQIVIFFLHAS